MCRPFDFTLPTHPRRPVYRAAGKPRGRDGDPPKRKRLYNFHSNHTLVMKNKIATKFHKISHFLPQMAKEMLLRQQFPGLEPLKFKRVAFKSDWNNRVTEEKTAYQSTTWGSIWRARVGTVSNPSQAQCRPLEASPIASVVEQSPCAIVRHPLAT